MSLDVAPSPSLTHAQQQRQRLSATSTSSSAAGVATFTASNSSTFAAVADAHYSCLGAPSSLYEDVYVRHPTPPVSTLPTWEDISKLEPTSPNNELFANEFPSMMEDVLPPPQHQQHQSSPTFYSHHSHHGHSLQHQVPHHPHSQSMFPGHYGIGVAGPYGDSANNNLLLASTTGRPSDLQFLHPQHHHHHPPMVHRMQNPYKMAFGSNSSSNNNGSSNATDIGLSNTSILGSDDGLSSSSNSIIGMRPVYTITTVGFGESTGTLWLGGWLAIAWERLILNFVINEINLAGGILV